MNVGADIGEGEYLDITLEVDTINSRDAQDKIEYIARCRDDDGERVMLTVFSDNRPSIDLQEGHRYHFSSVRGEREGWENDPGILFRPFSSVNPVEADAEVSGRESLRIVDVIPSASETGSRTDWVKSPLFVLGVLTAMAVLNAVASLFAPTFTDGARLGLVVVVFVLAMLAAYATEFRPSSRLRQSRTEEHTTLLLEAFRRDYDETVDESPPVRMNVMTPKSWWLKLVPRSLWSLPVFADNRSLGILTGTQEYRVDKAISWDPFGENGPEGACGRAFAESQVRIYDERDRTPTNLTDPQEHATEELGSILSVPIVPDTSTRPIGVLNVDSEEAAAVARFEGEEVQTLANRYAGLVADVLV